MRFLFTVLSRVRSFWWQGMTRHAHDTIRTETEALERFHDCARYGVRSDRIPRHYHRDDRPL